MAMERVTVAWVIHAIGRIGTVRVRAARAVANGWTVALKKKDPGKR